MKNLVLLVITVVVGIGASANVPSSQLYHDLQKIKSLKRVLYIAAHPDDENTRALAYFSLGEKAETGYLSLTRGDGGQNLIGDELSENLGVLRTQELLAARSWDGANQFFTRAVDFGYSRSAEESFKMWGKDEILKDVVYVIRQFKPDVIITRFPPDKRAGHGHHTASAMLAIEAVEKAGDPNYMPEQVSLLGTWKNVPVYWNASTWWDEDLDEKARNNPDYLVEDIGGYNELLGMSYNEIGTHARSQHKCQGFGAIVERGSRNEYFKHLSGNKLNKSFFEQQKSSWESLGNKDIEKDIDALLSKFDFVTPSGNVPELIKIQNKIKDLPESSIKAEKLTKINQLIIDCLGLYTEIIADDYAVVHSQKVEFTINLIHRSPLKVEWKSLVYNNKTYDFHKDLGRNQEVTEKVEVEATGNFSGPYWLKNPFTTLFNLDDPKNLGKAQEDPSFEAKAIFIIEGKEVEITLPATYKWRDPSYGERRRNVIITPDFTVNFEQDLAITKPGNKKTITAKIHGYKDKVQTSLQVIAPKGWIVSPSTFNFSLDKKHEEKWFSFTIEATEKSENGLVLLEENSGNTLFSETTIAYDHIPTQTYFKPAYLSVMALDAKITPGKVAYIRGVDDAVPQAIEELGFEVKTFEVKDLTNLNLNEFNSVVLGIRIYNVYPELKNYDTKLFDYVKEGGNLIMQYNTAGRSSTGETFGPYPFELSRNRVTEEDAMVSLLLPEHPIFNTPNKIGLEDFDNWVQERGLYFANNWAKEYQALISWHDTNEEPVEGGLIVAQYGKGQFIYTGISFFRELPRGVEGAYRLFANMLSYQPK